MTAWDNFLFGLVILFLVPFAVMVLSFLITKIVHFWLPNSLSPGNARPKSVREPIRPLIEGMDLQEAGYSAD